MISVEKKRSNPGFENLMTVIVKILHLFLFYVFEIDITLTGHL